MIPPILLCAGALLLVAGVSALASFQPSSARRGIERTDGSKFCHLHVCLPLSGADYVKINCSANDRSGSSQHNRQETESISTSSSRRTLLVSSVITAFNLFRQDAYALPFVQQDRRQLELCLVQILRTKYWAMNVAKSINTKLLSPTIATTTNDDSTDLIELSDAQRKQPYLEARLGAKALLTKKIGGGANSNVVKLAGFQFKECLEDGRYWCTELASSNILTGQSSGELKSGRRFCNNELGSISDDLLESLASLVEFDGLETLIDPSPRSSLMLKMYDNQKGMFVYRTLTERIIPSCDMYLRAFGNEKVTLCQEFARREYPDEIPVEILQRLYDSLPTLNVL